MINILNEVIKGLNIVEKERLKAEGCTNECFFKGEGLTEQYTFKVIEKKKYFYINCHNSGVFLIDRNGEIYNIKGYGVADQNKKLKANLGNIKDYINENGFILEKIRFLHSKHYNYLR